MPRNTSNLRIERHLNKPRFNHYLRRRAVLPALACMAALCGPATLSPAAITVSGDLAPIYNGIDDPWDINDVLSVGVTNDASMNIGGGSSVLNTTGYIGQDTGSTGEVTITGLGSTWSNTWSLVIGETGAGIVNIEDGGSVSSRYAVIGENPGSIGAATVTGEGSIWSIAHNLTVGYEGNGTLNIVNGGSASNLTAYIANRPGTTGAVTVNGDGSTWNNSGSLVIGFYGDGALNVQAGGSVLSNEGWIGGVSGSTSVASVTGMGSLWTISGPLSVGDRGEGTLNIELGGSVSNTHGFIAFATGTTGEVTVSGAGSTWNNSGYLYVDRLGNGTLNISNGGLVSNTLGFIGNSPGSTGIVTVTGSGSSWHNSDNMDVGRSGDGRLDIEAGGLVLSRNGSIGRYPDSIGVAIVNGAGSTWRNSDGLNVGGNAVTIGGRGDLIVSNGGLVEASTKLKLWHTGTVTLDGGNIVARTFDHTDGGVFNFLEGTLTVNRFLGMLDQDGGTLAPGDSYGDSLGTMSVFGGYNLNAGTLEIELGGTGNPHGFVTVIGDINIASLGTTLDLSPIGPMQAGMYTVIESINGMIVGGFQTIEFYGIAPALYDVQYTNNAVTLTLHQNIVPEPGTISVLAIGVMWGYGRRR